MSGHTPAAGVWSEPVANGRAALVELDGMQRHAAQDAFVVGGLHQRELQLLTALAGLLGLKPLMARLDLSISDFALVELNEAFASQGLAVLRRLGLPDGAEHVNPNGGAIALGHPLGMSGARLALTATEELQRRGGGWALCTMCIGVGQGIALAIERV